MLLGWQHDLSRSFEAQLLAALLFLLAELAHISANLLQTEILSRKRLDSVCALSGDAIAWCSLARGCKYEKCAIVGKWWYIQNSTHLCAKHHALHLSVKSYGSCQQRLMIGCIRAEVYVLNESRT